MDQDSMEPSSFSSRNPERVVRIANVLVVVALVAMLVGAVTLLLAREHTAMDLPAGEGVVFEGDAASWDPWGADLEVRIFGMRNTTAEVTLSTMDRETGEVESDELEIPSGRFLTWNEHAPAGEGYRVGVENMGEVPVRVSLTVSQLGNYWIGGALVLFGVFGFVFHRMGMQRA